MCTSTRPASSTHLVCGQIILCHVYVLCTQWIVTCAEILFAFDTQPTKHIMLYQSKKRKISDQVRGYIQIDRNSTKIISFLNIDWSFAFKRSDSDHNCDSYYYNICCNSTQTKLCKDVFDSTIVASQCVLWKCKNCIY